MSSTFSYNPYPSLSDEAKEKIMKMINLGIIDITNTPQRHEASDVQNFIRWCLDQKSN